MTNPQGARWREWVAGRGQGWKAVLALYAADLMGIGLSDRLTFTGYVPAWVGLSPNWTLFVLGTAALLLGLGLWTWASPLVTRRWVISYLGLQTVSLAFSLAALVNSIGAFQTGQGGRILFEDALSLWVINLLLFTLWYWKVDAGGPHCRTGKDAPHPPDILFAQRGAKIPGYEGWSPRFIDYLFLAFTTGTEFGPTDTAFLSRRCKVLAMAQSAISLSVLAILAARAVNLIR
jgi:hypothetical protein